MIDIAKPIIMLDCSNYTPAFTPQFVEWCRDNMNVGCWAVQAIDPPPAYPAGKTQAQLDVIRQVDGICAVGYVYPFFDSGPDDALGRLALLNGYEDIVRDVFLDLEDTGSQAALTHKLDVCREWLVDCDAFAKTLGSPKAGIYTGEGVWDGMGFPRSGNVLDFDTRNNWWASYNGQQTLVQPTRGVWGKVVAHQYLGTTSVNGIGGLDVSVIDAEYWQSLMVPSIGTDYLAKFGEQGNNSLGSAYDWPAVAENLEGIIHALQQTASNPINSNADDTVTAIRDVLAQHGYAN